MNTVYCVGIEGMPSSGVTSITVDVSIDDVTSTAVAAEQHWGQSSIEVHRAEFHDAASPDQHASGSALPVDPGEPRVAEPSASCKQHLATCLHPSV